MIGQTISHYKILEKIGEGGMGVVYKAEDTKLHRPVAVKFLPLGKSASKDQTRRFIREAQTAANLSHPNIATVFELNDIEDPVTHTTQAFIAMEYVEGQTLEETIRQGPILIDRVRDIAIQISRGLLSAHERGTIHRDIKPSNIIINKEGVAKLLDFGLAKLAQDPTVSIEGKIVGSVAYMSPEQVRGEKLDFRTDLWSFGVLLFQMLSRQLPFRGEHTPAMMYSIVNEEPPPVRNLRSDTPDDLAIICQRCLEKDRERRPRDAREILQILESKQSVSRPIHFQKLNAFTAIRHPLFWIGLFLLLVAVSIALWQPFSSPTLATKTLAKNWRIAVLPFEDLARNPKSSDWPEIIQALMTQELTGVEYLGVMDPSSLNGMKLPELHQALLNDSVSSTVRGRILPAQFGFRIQTYLIDVKSGEVRTAFPETEVRNEEDLIQAARASAEQIRIFFEITIQEAGEDKPVRAWHSSRIQNVAAVRAFLQAYRLIFRDMAGIEDKLLHAIELDSTFISPRIWLISRLTNQNKLGDAQAQLAALQRLEPYASPFEQAMIGWAKARVAGNISEQGRFLQLALDYSPGNNILIANLAMNYYKQEDYEGAVKTLEPLFTTAWDYPPIYALAGDCLIKIGQYSKSENLLVHSLRITPVYPKVYSMLAALAAKEGRTAEAERYEKLFVKRCIEQKKDLSRAYEDLGNEFANTGQNNKARQYFEQSLQLDSTSAEAAKLREFMRPSIH